MNAHLKTFTVVIGLFSIHWISIQAYSYYCASPGLWGYFESLLKTPSSLCVALNYIQFYSIDYYYKTWIAILVLGTNYLANLVKLTHNVIPEPVPEKSRIPEYHIQTRSKTNRLNT